MKKPASLALVFCSASWVAALLAGCQSPADLPAPSFQVRESVEQLEVTHATPNVELGLYDADGTLRQKGSTDALGSLVFRQVPAGTGYTIHETEPLRAESAPALRVLGIKESYPSRDFYRTQVLTVGSTYIKTRDGTLLSAYVTLPGPPEKGPYPTVVNYSGYDPSRPGEANPDLSGLCGSFPVLCDQPADGSAYIASLFGYATVGVNMRGTGCSGGAYGFFDTIQKLDAYDVIEAVAAQPWVLHNKVGMTGLSYPGISQFFVAATQPPSLAAITPLSVFGETFQTTSPGGILNTGFAVAWAQDVVDRAGPYGQGWEQKRVDAGDQVCAENQLLHGQKLDLIKQIHDNPFYSASVEDPVSPTAQAGLIQVPVFTACAFQDEQTGPFFNTLFSRLTQSPLVRVNLYNGVHVDGFSPQILVEWKTFLDLYVAQRIPSIDPQVRKFLPVLAKTIFGTMLELPPDRFATQPSWEAARAAYEKEPPVRVLFESGAKSVPGAPESTFEQKFSAWPPAEITPVRYYLNADGTLAKTAPVELTAGSLFAHDPDAGQRSLLMPKGNVWDLLPQYDWQQPRPGYAAAFTTEPLAQDLALLGTASADLWLQSSAADAELQATLTEIRPDGQEVYVQSGWLRASQRQLASEQTDLWPAHTHTAADAAPLPTGKWSPVRVGIPGLGHVLRAGSRLRLLLDTPGGTRAVWRFQLQPLPAGTRHRIAHSASNPSSLLLPLVPTVHAPVQRPACPSLRGQPCRPYLPLTNTPTG
jgi:predicted acyl esterase